MTTPMTSPMTWTTALDTSTHATARAQVLPALRLTRRGRLVVLLALVTLVFAAFSLGRAGTEAAPLTDSGTSTDTVNQTVVHQGETLWAVAQRVAPGRDPRAVISRIQELNGLRGGQVRAGQLLILPG